MQLFAGTGGRHVKQALGFFVFPPRMLFGNPTINISRFAIAADGSNDELSLLLLRSAQQTFLLDPVEQRLCFDLGGALQPRYDHYFETQTLRLVNSHQLYSAVLVGTWIRLSAKFVKPLVKSPGVRPQILEHGKEGAHVGKAGAVDARIPAECRPGAFDPPRQRDLAMFAA